MSVLAFALTFNSNTSTDGPNGSSFQISSSEYQNTLQEYGIILIIVSYTIFWCFEALSNVLLLLSVVDNYSLYTFALAFRSEKKVALARFEPSDRNPNTSHNVSLYPLDRELGCLSIESEYCISVACITRQKLICNNVFSS